MENYRGMAIFVQVVESKGFSAAARKLGLTKSAISQQITQLENELGTRLLNRSTRNLSLTEPGVEYYRGCAQMVEVAASTNAHLSLIKQEPHGTIRLACPYDFGSRHLAPLLTGFLRQYPKLKLDLYAEDQVINMVEEGIDLTLRIGHPANSALVARKITTLPLILCAAPEYLAIHGTPQTPEDLLQHDWIAFTQWAAPNQLILKNAAGRQWKLRLHGTIRTNSSLSIQSFAVAGMGIGRLPKFSVESLVRQEKLAVILPEYRMEPLGLYALYPDRQHLPLKVRLIIDYLIDHFVVDAHSILNTA